MNKLVLIMEKNPLPVINHHVLGAFFQTWFSLWKNRRGKKVSRTLWCITKKRTFTPFCFSPKVLTGNHVGMFSRIFQISFKISCIQAYDDVWFCVTREEYRISYLMVFWQFYSILPEEWSGLGCWIKANCGI